jgi:hypothetical protein
MARVVDHEIKRRQDMQCCDDNTLSSDKSTDVDRVEKWMIMRGFGDKDGGERAVSQESTKADQRHAILFRASHTVIEPQSRYSFFLHK